MKDVNGATTYFLGAGASAADGLPITWQLNFGVAAFLAVPSRGAALRRYYELGFGVTLSAIRNDARIWEKYIDESRSLKYSPCLPDLVETLSVLDVNIAEGRSLGPGLRRPGDKKDKLELHTEIELSNSVLRQARGELVDALRVSIVQAITKSSRSPVASTAFLKRLRYEDHIVTTNWDYLIEKVLSKRQKKLDGGWLKKRNMTFGCIGERIVDWRGNDLIEAADKKRTIYKLHGGVNWYLCERCNNLYVNVEYTPGSLEQLTNENGGCHCRADLSSLIVAPSYLKDYNNSHLKSVWRNAQIALQESNQWVFVGYSLPQDDYHIRAMLLRALCVRRSNRRTRSTSIVVVTDGKPDDAQTNALFERYDAFFRSEPVTRRSEGFRKYLGVPDSV